MLVRAEWLGDGLSRYLVDRIEATPNIAVHLGVEVTSVHGVRRLERVVTQDVRTREERELDPAAMFIFIGSAPHTGMVAGLIELDDKGYVLTGPDLPRGSQGRPRGWTLDRDPFLFETSVPGIFAVGDVRAGFRQTGGRRGRRGIRNRQHGPPLPPDRLIALPRPLVARRADPAGSRWTATEAGGTVPRMTHVLLNRLTAKPGQRQRVVEILLESGRLFDDNPACLLYLVSESTDDPDLVWVIDLWTSQVAHAEALKAPELRPFVEQAMPLLEGMPEQIEVRPVGGKGLPG
jgi:quinol monooxygenase YgiN